MARTVTFLTLLTLSHALFPRQSNYFPVANSSSITSQSVTLLPITLSNSSSSTFSSSLSSMNSSSRSLSGSSRTTTNSIPSSTGGCATVSSSSTGSSSGQTGSISSSSSNNFSSPGSSSSVAGTSSSSNFSATISSKSSSMSTRSASSSASKSAPGSGVLPFPTSSSSISTAPFSFTNPYTDIESTLTPVLFTWFNMPTSTISDAATTSEAVFLDSLFFALQANRKWLTDENLKSQYLDTVRKTQEETESLLNDLNVKPPDVPDCHNTKRKRTAGSGKLSERQLRTLLLNRSVISSIGNAISGIHEVSTLISCAGDVIKSLVDSVNAKVLDLNEIENLTDTLADIGGDLKDNGDDGSSSIQGSSSTQGPSSSASASSASSSSSSSCSGSIAVPICTDFVFLSTMFMSGGTSIATVATITQTTCVTSTISRCSGSGSTTTLTTSSSSGSSAAPTQIPAFVGADTDALDSALASNITSFQQYLGCGPLTFTLPIPTAGCNLDSDNSTSSSLTTGSSGSTLASGPVFVSSSGSQTPSTVSATESPSATGSTPISGPKSASASSSNSKGFPTVLSTLNANSSPPTTSSLPKPTTISTSTVSTVFPTPSISESFLHPSTSSTNIPPYATGQCTVHIWQGLGLEVGESDVYIDANISDAAGSSIGDGQGGVNWGGTVSIQSKLANLLQVTPQTGLLTRHAKRSASANYLHWKRFGASPPRPAYEKGPIEFVVGHQQWNTSSSACSVGNWDNGNANDFLGTLIFGDKFLPNRRTDCKFYC